MIMANFTRLLTFPFDLAGARCSNKNANNTTTDTTGANSTALVESSGGLYSKGSKFIKGIILRPSTLTGGSSKKHEISEAKPQIHKKPSLQTKGVKKITRQDLINGKYDHLNSNNSIKRGSTMPTHKSHSYNGHPHHHNHRRHSHRSRSKNSSSRSSTKSPLASHQIQSPRPTIEISQIDDFDSQNEMFIPAQQQINNYSTISKPHTSKRASDSDVLLNSYNSIIRHYDDGMLTIPVHRSITADSDVSDYITYNKQ